MGRVLLNALYKRRVEQIRVSTLSPEEVATERIQKAAEAVTLASKQLEELKQELVQIDQKYQLSYNQWGVPSCGFGSFAEAAFVQNWWQDYARRFSQAQADFNNKLSIWAGLKLQN